jgi:hypothetical protein
LEGERHHIPNGLFIATLRDLGLPEEQIFNSPNAKVPLGGRADKAIRQLMKESSIHA